MVMYTLLREITGLKICAFQHPIGSKFFPLVSPFGSELIYRGNKLISAGWLVWHDQLMKNCDAHSPGEAHFSHAA